MMNEKLLTIEDLKALGYTLRQTSITMQYRKQWGLWEAIREIEQNSLDETEKVCDMRRISSTRLIMSDNGNGFEIKYYLLIGLSNKKVGARGQYGEGLKIAQIVLLRLGIQSKVRSRDWEAISVIDEFEGVNTLAFMIKKGLPQIKGTEIELINANYKDIKKLVTERILPINPKEMVGYNKSMGMVLTGKYIGKLYNRRIYVQELEKAVFGYDLYNLTLGTDRQAGRQWEIRQYAGNIMVSITEREVVRKVINAFKRDTFEARMDCIRLNHVFEEVFYDEYGDAKISDDETMRGKLSHKGAKMVKFQSQDIVEAFERQGIETATEFIKKDNERLSQYDIINMNTLDSKKKSIITRAIAFVEETQHFGKDYIKSLMDTDKLILIRSNDDDKRCFTDYDSVFMNIKRAISVERFVGSLVHELIHIVTKAPDLTEEFQHEWQEWTMSLTKHILKGHVLKAHNLKTYRDGNNIKFILNKKHAKKLGCGEYYTLKVYPI